MVIVKKAAIKGRTVKRDCASLYPNRLRGYWADVNGNKIDKITFGSVVRFYIETYWAYNARIKIYIKSNNSIILNNPEEKIVENTIDKLIPDYFAMKKNFFEIKLKSLGDYKVLHGMKDFELFCDITEGFNYFYGYENVAKIEINKKKSWFDPVDNPQINKYSFNGNIKPWSALYGDVRKGNTSPYHSGIDLFALPGTPIYACVNGIVKDVNVNNASKSSAGMTIRIKAKNNLDYFEREAECNYKLLFEYKGEESGISFKNDDDIYFIYMHLSECFVIIGQEVTAGSLIGRSGVSGSIATGTQGPHLHFEIAKVVNAYGTGKTARTNPAKVLNLSSYNNMVQDQSVKFRYYQNGTTKKI